MVQILGAWCELVEESRWDVIRAVDTLVESCGMPAPEWLQPSLEPSRQCSFKYGRALDYEKTCVQIFVAIAIVPDVVAIAVTDWAYGRWIPVYSAHIVVQSARGIRMEPGLPTVAQLSTMRTHVACYVYSLRQLLIPILWPAHWACA